MNHNNKLYVINNTIYLRTITRERTRIPFL